MQPEVKPGLSIIVPVLNERGTLAVLLNQLSHVLDGVIPYEVIAIDDHSTDGSFELLLMLTARYPLRVYRKQGRGGKAQSLREGFSYAHYQAIAFIDADLQYPPQALLPMYRLLERADVVVSSREEWRGVSRLRRSASRCFSLLTSYLLFRLPYDTQSGLKVFRRELLPFSLLPSSSWNFDLPFLWHAQQAGKTIVSYPIVFSLRAQGVSKINIVSTAWHLLWSALGLRLHHSGWLPITDPTGVGEAGNGIIYRGQRYVTHTKLQFEDSALVTITRWQGIALLLIVSAVLLGLIWSWTAVLLTIVSGLTVMYVLDLLFTFWLAVRSFITSPEITIPSALLASLNDTSLPIYSILCPLYREAAILEQYIAALTALDWPKDKLDVQLLLEEDDLETKAAVERSVLPHWIRVNIVPAGQPQTKPKACNWGLSHARGEYVVIYDAEDIPAPDQLKKAYCAFRQLPSTVACLQAKLGYYNTNQNILTRLFAIEYHLWFSLILPGLQSLGALIPLGGTSNHFRRSILDRLHGWDAFNVTEDCDMGIRLFRAGYQTAMIDSVTLEEANSRLKNWLRQRSRWIKGYMQSYLVALRRPSQLVDRSPLKLLYFHLTIGSKVFSVLLNPLFWIMTVGYVVARSSFEPLINTIYPTPLLYMGSISLVVGNFLYFYSHMLALAKKEQWWLVKYVLFIPFYWLLMSLGAWYALFQLITRPHYWEKTIHGLHLSTKERSRRAEAALVQQEV